MASSTGKFPKSPRKNRNPPYKKQQDTTPSPTIDGESERIVYMPAVYKIVERNFDELDFVFLSSENNAIILRHITGQSKDFLRSDDFKKYYLELSEWSNLAPSERGVPGRASCHLMEEALNLAPMISAPEYENCPAPVASWTDKRRVLSTPPAYSLILFMESSELIERGSKFYNYPLVVGADASTCMNTKAEAPHPHNTLALRIDKPTHMISFVNWYMRETDTKETDKEYLELTGDDPYHACLGNRKVLLPPGYISRVEETYLVDESSDSYLPLFTFEEYVSSV